MAGIDQRSGADRRDADDPTGSRPRIPLGRTAITGWALTAVFVLAGVGTALGATPVPVLPAPVADVTPGAGPAAGAVFGPFAVGPTMDTVTAPSVPTASAAPQGAAAGATAAAAQQGAFTSSAPDDRARRAVTTALAQLGLPYVWGGDGPTRGDAGFDCSGLTSFSYGTTGVQLPRTAQTQYQAGPHLPTDAPLQPGDLVFYGVPSRVHHVGMYIGEGRMVNAPTFGEPVQVAFYRYRGDDYLGATRPAPGDGTLTTGPLPSFPIPAPGGALGPAPVVPQPRDQVFRAPVASLPAVLPQPGDPAPPERESAARSVAESDAVAARTAPSSTVRPVQGPVAVAGTTSASPAPVTTPVTSTTATSTTATASSPAGAATSATSTTSAPPARPTTVATATGSTRATTTATRVPTRTTAAAVTTRRTTTPPAPTTEATWSRAAARTTADDPTTRASATSRDESTEDDEPSETTRSSQAAEPSDDAGSDSSDS